MSTGLLPRPQTIIIAIPRADAEEGCHFPVIFRRPSRVGDGRGEEPGAASSPRTHPRRVLMTRRTQRTSPEGESSALSLLRRSRPPLLVALRVVCCFSREWPRRAGSRHRRRRRERAPSRCAFFFSLLSKPKRRPPHTGIDCHSRAPRASRNFAAITFLSPAARSPFRDVVRPAEVRDVIVSPFLPRRTRRNYSLAWEGEGRATRG